MGFLSRQGGFVVHCVRTRDSRLAHHDKPKAGPAPNPQTRMDPQAKQTPPENLAAVILAGGQGLRMGGRNKGWVEYRGRPLIEHAIARLRPQAPRLAISSNTDIDRYQALGFPVLTDSHADYRGPLAGIAAAFAAFPDHAILCAPVDAPELPLDLECRLRQALETHPAPAAIAHDGHRLQPLFGLLEPAVATRLQSDLAHGSLAVGRWFHEIGAITVDFSDQPEAFANINTPGDLMG
ncbi:molybdenum cofactor guanylyltransferase MobA [Thioalkalivibrio sp. ALE28]|uniref:molybdenum cofactor guanylyltransferase MobA n=1 Tax=Thioalkalivibrio sp. ALE28 TaxID=1158179 RepID=UPI0003787A3B|nr:molybdenum cofactor guanylyltransferase MobA [Thioalkalivibrio sp. ALE28]